MPETNLEMVRRAVQAAIRRPKPDFATMNALFDPDHEYVSRVEALEGGSRQGARGYRDWLLNAEDTMEWETTLEELIEIDDDRVLAITPTRIQGKSSGAAFEQRLGCIITVRDGKVIRTELYSSPDEALAAAGLSE